jgi:hypothetical protein
MAIEVVAIDKQYGRCINKRIKNIYCRSLCTCMLQEVLPVNQLPIFEQLHGCERILIAGAGGGWDVFSGLPLYFYLKGIGKEVHLANYSFSLIPATKSGLSLHSAMHEVRSQTRDTGMVFPEKYLCEWFQTQGQDVSVWCFPRTGCVETTQAYRALVEHLNVDAIVLADGGTDSLLRGDENGLGTPVEDMISIAAVDSIPQIRKFLLSVGFGIDYHHGVSHAQVLESVAGLTVCGGFLGALSLMAQMPEVRQYELALKYVFDRTRGFKSIVCTSILDALAGKFGNHHSNLRTRGSSLWINPLMTFCWFFDLSVLASRVMYLEELKKTKTQSDASKVICAFRRDAEIKDWDSIPI